MNPKCFAQIAVKITYKLILDSCENCPKIVATFDEVPADKLDTVLYHAKKAFRSIEVINNITGEVCYSRYVSDEMFEKRHIDYTYGEVLDIIKDKISH